MRLWWALVVPLAGPGCFLPEVTVDDDLALPEQMDPGSDSSGPTGGGGGDDAERERLCSSYCARFMRLCAGHPAATYGNERECDEICLLGGWPLGDSTDTPNSVRCREYHSILAETDAEMHCYHAAETPSRGFCEDPVVDAPQ
jgi:hypothetical protein